VELAVISAWSIAINADDELVGLWTVSDKVWFPGVRPSYDASNVDPDVVFGFVTPSSSRSYVMEPVVKPDNWIPFPAVNQINVGAQRKHSALTYPTTELKT
jgi:hypothetical protein